MNMQTPLLFTLAASPKPYHKRFTSYFIILFVVSTLFVITAGQWGYPITLANILSPILPSLGAYLTMFC